MKELHLLALLALAETLILGFFTPNILRFLIGPRFRYDLSHLTAQRALIALAGGSVAYGFGLWLGPAAAVTFSIFLGMPLGLTLRALFERLVRHKS